MREERPIAAYDLKPDDFPLTITFVEVGTDRVWHEIEVSGPGVVDIPSCRDYGVEKTSVRVTTASGVRISEA